MTATLSEESTIKTVSDDVVRTIYLRMNIMLCRRGTQLTMVDFIESLSVIELRRAIAEGDESVLHPQRRSFDVNLSKDPFD